MTNSTITNKEIVTKLNAIISEIVDTNNGVTAVKNPEMERICQAIKKVADSIELPVQEFDPMAPIY